MDKGINEIRNPSKVNTKYNVAYVVLSMFIVITISMGFVFADFLDVTLSHKVKIPENLKYTTADTIEGLSDFSSQMTSIDKFKDVTDEKKYIKFNFTVPASDKTQKLRVRSYYHQTIVIINGNEVVDDMSNSKGVSDKRQYILEVQSSETDNIVSVVLKGAFAKNFKMYIMPYDYNFLATVSDFVAIVFWPACVAFFVIMNILKRRRIHNSIASTEIFAYIFCLGATIDIYSQYVPGNQMFFNKIGYMIICSAGLFFLNTIYKNHGLSEKIRNIVIGIGVLIIAMNIPKVYGEISVYLIMILTIYNLCTMLIALFLFCRNKEKKNARYIVDVYYGSFCIQIVLRYLFTLGLTEFEGLYLQILFPLVAAIFNSIEFVSEKKSNALQNSNTLLEFKPSDLGRFQEVFDIFIQEPEYYNHSRNVSLYVNAICKELNMPEEENLIVSQAAFLHDIGKIMVPKSILFKTGKLSEDEYEKIKVHTDYGASLFENSDDNVQRIACVIARQHHERFDGNGYIGLVGDEINKYAQIVSIADVFDAATAKRSYKKSWSFEEGFHYIESHKGTLFNPIYTDAFVNAKDSIYEIYKLVKE